MLLWTAESTERARMDPKRSDSKGKAVHAGVGMHFCPPILHSSTTEASSSPTDTVRSVSTGTTRMPIGYRSSADRERAKGNSRPLMAFGSIVEKGKTTHRHLRPRPPHLAVPGNGREIRRNPQGLRYAGKLGYLEEFVIGPRTARPHHLAQREERRCRQIGGRRRERGEKKTVNRSKTQTWKTGKFVHPHDACFGANGDISLPSGLPPGV